MLCRCVDFCSLCSIRRILFCFDLHEHVSLFAVVADCLLVCLCSCSVLIGVSLLRESLCVSNIQAMICVALPRRFCSCVCLFVCLLDVVLWCHMFYVIICVALSHRDVVLGFSFY